MIIAFFFSDFLRNKFPYKLISNINKNNVDSFLSGWIDNRIRALIFDRKESIRLRYLFIAFYYRDRVAFGFVQVNILSYTLVTILFRLSHLLFTHALVFSRQGNQKQNLS